MKHRMILLTAALSLLLVTGLTGTAAAQTDDPVSTDDTETVDHLRPFVDENGDGYNDLSPDADGDGIPNGQDPDYIRNPDGRRGRGNGGFVDADGDGLNDLAQDTDGDGIPNGRDPDYVRPEDGSGSQNTWGHRRGKMGGSGGGRSGGGSGCRGGRGGSSK